MLEKYGVDVASVKASHIRCQNKGVGHVLLDTQVHKDASILCLPWSPTQLKGLLASCLGFKWPPLHSIPDSPLFPPIKSNDHFTLLARHNVDTATAAFAPSSLLSKAMSALQVIQGLINMPSISITIKVNKAHMGGGL